MDGLQALTVGEDLFEHHQYCDHNGNTNLDGAIESI